MFNPQKLIEEYECLADGKPMLKGIKMAIKEADDNKAYEWSLYFRERYIQESIFHGDSLDACIIFPEYVALFDSHPELHEKHLHKFMIRFKWVIENTIPFYQISLEQIESYFEEFKRRCLEYGYSLRTYYMKKASIYEHIDLESTKKYYEQFKKLKRDNLSDCYACELNSQVRFELLFNDIKTALKTAEPILNGRTRCGEIPQETYGSLIYAFTKAGQFKEAKYYTSLVYKQIKGKMDFMHIIGYIMSLYSVTNLNKGLDVFNSNISCVAKSKNPEDNFYFYNGAYRLFKSILNTDTTVLCHNIPRSMPIYDSSNVYDVATLADYFYKMAKDIAEKLDNRNGTNYFTAQLNYQFKQSDTLMEIPKHINDATRTPSIMSIPIAESLDFLSLKDTISKRFVDMNAKLLSINKTNRNDSTESVEMTVEYLNHTYTFDLWISERLIPIDISNFKHKILKKDFEESFINPNVKYSVVCSTNLDDDIEKNFHLQIKLLCALGLPATCIFDVSRNTVLSYKWLELCAYSDVPPLVEYMVNIEIIRSDDENIWLYTKGLSCMGIRELEMVGIKPEYIDQYYHIMMFTIEYIFYCHVLVNEKQSIATFYDRESNNNVTITWIDTNNALKHIPKNMLGSSKYRDSKNSNTANILIHLNSINKKALYMWELPEEFIDKVYCPTVHLLGNRLTKLAFERLPILKKLLESDMKYSVNITLEAPISEIHNSSIDNNIINDEDDDYYDEYDDFHTFAIYLDNIDDNGIATGNLLCNVDTEYISYSKGEIISIDIDYMQDWCIYFEDGSVVTPDTMYKIIA